MPGLKLTREQYIKIYIDKGAKVLDTGPGDAIVYGYIASNGKPAGVAFSGKRAKPDWAYYFSDENRRSVAVRIYMDKVRKREEDKAERRRQKKTPVPVREQRFVEGKVVVYSWGYEQTNIDFYKIIKRTGRFVWLVEMGQEEVKGGDMQGYVVPTMVLPNAKPFRRMVHASNGEERGVAIRSYGWGNLWDGKPEHYTAYY